MKLTQLFFAAALFTPAVQAASVITTFAGNGSAGFTGDGSAATSAALNLPVFVATDAAGNVYIADQNNNRIRKVNIQGVISTFAGNGANGFGGDGGPATGASLSLPTGVFADSLGNVFIADVGNNRIRKVDAGGTITTVAGSGSRGFGGDGGPATSASFLNPVRAIIDNSGNMYIADQSNHRVRKVDASGIVTTVAGTGAANFSGDGGPAVAAALNNPTAVAVDTGGNLFITDQFNHRIRRVDAAGKITTIAGNGAVGFAGDGGAATAASLNYPGGLIVDTAGNIFFADDLNWRVRQVSPSGVITTIAGNGTQGFSGDGGAPTSAALNGEFGIALDPSGNLLIADSANNRVRTVSAASPIVPVFSARSITNGASFVAGASAGSLGTIFGQHLSVNLQGVAGAAATPLPSNLNGTTVTINGISAPLVAVVNLGGQEQINFQTPWELAGQTSASFVVSNAVGVSAAVTVPLSVTLPAIFTIDGTNGAIEHLDGSIVTAANPAAPGEYVVVFANALGPVVPAVSTGKAALGSPLSTSVFATTATIAGAAANVIFSGQAPFFVGLYQVNLQVPVGTKSGSQDLVLSANGTAGKAVKIAVK